MIKRIKLVCFFIYANIVFGASPQSPTYRETLETVEGAPMVQNFTDNVRLFSKNIIFEYYEGDDMMFTCSCIKSNPLPNISLRIGDDTPCIVSYQTSANASKKAEILDFDKKVVCVVHHPLLGDQGYTISRPLTILYKPEYISQSIHKVGRNISINVTVSAFPKPHAYSWTRNNGMNLILENSWLARVKDKHCIWEVGVHVPEVTNDDLEHGFALKIANSEGHYKTIVIPDAKNDKSSSIYTFFVVIGQVILLVIGCVVNICILKALSDYIARRSVSRDAPVPSNRRAGCNAVKKAAKKEDGAHPLIPNCCIPVTEESSNEDEKSPGQNLCCKKIVKVEQKNPTYK